jgi:phytoene synthase
VARNTSFYYAFLVLPPEKRRAILAVFDFCRAVDDSVDLARTASDAAAAIARWRRELVLIFDAGTPVSREGRAIKDAASRFALERTHFEALVDGVEMDVHPRQYRTFAELEQYCHRVASAVGLMSIPIFGYRDPAVPDYARDLGVALQLTNILRDVAADYRRGRVYLPLEDLERFGCTVDRIGQAVANASAPLSDEALRQVLAHQAARARLFFSRAVRVLPAQDAPAMLPAEIMRAIYWDLLKRIEAAGCDVFRNRLRVPRPARAWIAVRTWWKVRSTTR